MKKVVITIFTLCVGFFFASAQRAGIKTNLAHWAVAATPNASVEVALNQHYTLDIYGALNAIDFSGYRKFKHRLVQPELRYWKETAFEGHYFGLHALAADFNVGGFDWPVGRLKNIKDNRYEGTAFGAGLSYGYQWQLHPAWRLEAAIGAGYARLNYDVYKCVKCGETTNTDVKENYFGVTKAAVAIVFVIQ